MGIVAVVEPAADMVVAEQQALLVDAERAESVELDLVEVLEHMGGSGKEAYLVGVGCLHSARTSS